MVPMFHRWDYGKFLVSPITSGIANCMVSQIAWEVVLGKLRMVDDPEESPPAHRVLTGFD